MLIMFFCLRKSIIKIISALGDLITQVSEFRFKDLIVVLKNKDIPEESKTLITQYFVATTNDAKESLKALHEVMLPLRNLIGAIKNNHYTVSELSKTKQIVIEKLEMLKNCLLMLPKDLAVNEKITSLKKIINILRTTPENLEQSAFPIIQALSELDMRWKQEDPTNYLFLKNLEEKLLSILTP